MKTRCRAVASTAQRAMRDEAGLLLGFGFQRGNQQPEKKAL